MKLQELCHHLDSLFNASLFNDYGPNGLQVEGKKEVKKVLTAVSASLETIQQAANQGADALIVHHGIFWNRDAFPLTGVKGEKIRVLMKHGISLLAYHLPMDAHQEIGNNWKAALDMGWKNLEPFCKVNGMPIGVMGTIKLCSRKEFQKSLENYYQHEAATAFGGKDKIQKCALISGGAYKQLDEAAGIKADAFITGNFDEPAWHQASELGINFFALGHAATERVGPKALAEYLKKKKKMDASFLSDENPF